MKQFWKEFNKQKGLFRSYYCSGCKQAKPCQLLAQSVCCSCAYQSSQQDYQAEQQEAQAYSNYQTVYQQKVKEKQEQFQQYQLLKGYGSCPQCGSKTVDFYLWDEEKKLTCSYCLTEKNQALELERRKKKGENLYPLVFAGSNPVSFSEKQKWYKKYWKIVLTEWLSKFQCLPVNANCAKEWLKDKEHLKKCACLEQEIHQARQRAEEWVKYLAHSLQEKQELLKKCSCQKSEKFRVDSDYYAWCERCEESISVASKKRVIKNRNDPRFWGLKVEEKVLCGDCLANLVEKMPKRKKYLFREYEKRGYWSKK